jgi:hypothetical protein
MKKFKFQEVIDFIKKTPDETPVDFGNSTNDSECGCLMVQFGRSKGLKFSACNYKGDAFYGVYPDYVAEIEDFPSMNVIEHFNGDHAKTFGEVKEYLKQKGEL